jgi:Tol biopolymer transport system component
VLARFEAERQALARLDHPHIAKVFDAGATEKGRPYFVMDLIIGEPMTGYCDQRNLPVSRRLELFLQLCEAVQHAHSRGIIHRDLKPSNVVVTEKEGKPLVKVIDFGIAKSMQGRLTDKTLFTRREVLLGTPVYMSPEQLDLDRDTVDGRSDVYSLGVLLYELIAGAAPYEGDTLRQAAFSEVHRILREVEPPKPSTRFEHLGSKTSEIAQHRAVDPGGLRRLLRGDLDWVVMRALEKDPRRRYATAEALAQDLQRHLLHEPVAAGPPSLIYRGQKFAVRHQGALAAAAAIVLIASLALLFGLRQAREAQRAAERARLAEEQVRAGAGRTGLGPNIAGTQRLIQDIVSVEEGAQLSPDETMLAYVRWDGPDADIWLRDLETGEQRNLTQAEKHRTGVYEACLDLFVWSPDSKSLAYLWDDGTALSLRLIAVNKSLPKVSLSGTNQTYSVQLDLNVSRPRILFTETDRTRYLPETWAHDGRHLLCRRKQPDGMVLIDIETGAMRPLPISQVLEHPRFSPDDRYLVFSRSNHLYLLEMETGRVTPLTSGSSRNTTPIWAPNDSAVLYSSDRLGNWDLWGIRIEDDQALAPAELVRYGVGNHVKRLTQSGRLIIHRKIAPTDGYTIAQGPPLAPLPPSNLPGTLYFAVDGRIHTMTADGANKRALPPNVRGEPSTVLHGGHRWFLASREVPGNLTPPGTHPGNCSPYAETARRRSPFS